jgi:hypothetical protein
MQRLLVTFLMAACLACAQGCAMNGQARLAWERDRGGLATAPCDGRPARALARVAPERCSLRLTIGVLQNEAPEAHSFKDGAIYVSTGLLAQLTDDELAAVVAHELGHLMIDGLLATEPAALAGHAATLAAEDEELHADLLARQVLDCRGIPPAALTIALAKVADVSKDQPFYVPLTRRVVVLKGMDRRE